MVLVPIRRSNKRMRCIAIAAHSAQFRKKWLDVSQRKGQLGVPPSLLRGSWVQMCSLTHRHVRHRARTGPLPRDSPSSNIFSSSSCGRPTRGPPYLACVYNLTECWISGSPFWTVTLTHTRCPSNTVRTGGPPESARSPRSRVIEFANRRPARGRRRSVKIKEHNVKAVKKKFFLVGTSALIKGVKNSFFSRRKRS